MALVRLVPVDVDRDRRILGAARIDGSLEPLNTPLKSGQTVEIITARHARPNAAWLNFVKTAKARSHIRNFLRNQREDEAVRLGRRLIEIAMRDLGVPLAKLREDAAEPVLKAYGLKDVEELYAAIGTGERLAPLVARHFLPDQNSPDAETTPKVRELFAGAPYLQPGS